MWLAYKRLCWRSANPWPSLKTPFPVSREVSHLQGEPTTSQNRYRVLRNEPSTRRVGSYAHSSCRSRRPSCQPAPAKATSPGPRRGSGRGTVRCVPAANTSPLPKPQCLSMETHTTALKLQNRPVLSGGRCGRLSVPWLPGRTATQSQMKQWRGVCSPNVFYQHYRHQCTQPAPTFLALCYRSYYR